ncbi:FAD/FMN-containing dehydrogenase [Rhodobium orientis]|uniref:FAD-binding oxidoreductase n=1 Tax=Rhodobium orientis TaxID=34017 RepID=UPI00182CDAF4|nr:FAD-binding oxidoreductase [Rhodobium orientis]MBB4301636.1 FAD/FMN-containing dehydrogenase [Rhodobium orientis]
MSSASPSPVAAGPAPLVAELQELLGPKGLITEPAEMEPFVVDWRGRKRGTALAVVLPATTEEVSAAVRLATAAGVPVFPQGGNTGLCYGTVPGSGGPGNTPGLVIALNRMNRIREIDRTANLMTVDAGVILANAHEEAAAVGRQVPMYLGSEGSAQIGGLISTNAGGTGVVRYGPMRDLVAGVEVVLADGRVLSDLAGLKKNNTGYDLKHCFVGAEGTLGVITGAVLRMFPELRSEANAWVSVKDPADALTLLSRLQDDCDPYIQAFELLSASQVDIAFRHVPGLRMPFETTPAWNLMIELGSPDGDLDLHARFETFLAAAYEDGLVEDGFLAQSKAQAEEIWRVRHSLSESNKKEGVGVVLDISIRNSRAAEFIHTADRGAADAFPEAEIVVVSHLGDGNVHYILMFPHDYWQGLGSEEARDAKADEVMVAFHDVAAALGGSFSAEHGIGRKLTGELQRLCDPLRYEMMTRMKAAFDPDNLMNPGVLFGN